MLPSQMPQEPGPQAETLPPGLASAPALGLQPGVLRFLSRQCFVWDSDV